MYWWRHFDAAEVTQDFGRIRTAGFHTVRFFLRREDFQPTPARVVPAMLWCYGDYAQGLWGTPPLDEAVHERYFGLWRHAYSARPALAEVRHLADSERCAYRDTQDWIDIAADEFYTHPQAHLRRLYQRFRMYCGEECGEGQRD
jgi:hypothetical protein